MTTITTEMQFHIIQLTYLLKLKRFHYETKTSFDKWTTLYGTQV